MIIIDLNEEQIEEIETRLSSYDEKYITYKMNGCIQIGVEDDGRLIAGLDAVITAYRRAQVRLSTFHLHQKNGLGSVCLPRLFHC